MILRDDENLSPRLHVAFGGREYAGENGPKSFSLSGSITNIYDGFSFELDNVDGRNNHIIDEAKAHRWTPITIRHSDPLVDNGAPIPALQGVITGIEYNTSAGASTIAITGYDLGKVLDSCALPWVRLRGKTWGQLTDICLDSSWRAGPSTSQVGTGTAWGIQRVVGVDLNRKIKLGRQQAIIDYGQTYQQFVPPIQIEPGESCYDLLSRYAKMQAAGQGGVGSLVAVSALGDLMIFNPDDSKDDAAIYSFQYHLDSRNQRIKDAQLKLSGDDLYSEFRMYSSIITRPGDPNKRDSYDPNAAKIKSISSQVGYLGVFRRWAGAEAEQYSQKLLDARVEWRRKMALWNEWSLTYTVQGHSMPGAGALSGRWIPIVEGNNVEIEDTRNRVRGKYIIESVTRTQRPAPEGTTSRIVIRKLGLLGA